MKMLPSAIFYSPYSKVLVSTMYGTLYSPESSGLKIQNKILIYLLFHSCWIRIHEVKH